METIHGRVPWVAEHETAALAVRCTPQAAVWAGSECADPSDSNASDDGDEGWGVVGRRGRTLDAASVQRAAEATAPGPEEAAPLVLALPAAVCGGAGDTWPALRQQPRPVPSASAIDDAAINAG